MEPLNPNNFIGAYLQNYEALLAEARSKKDSLISKAVETAEVSRMHAIQYKLDEFAKEKKAVTDVSFLPLISLRVHYMCTIDSIFDASSSFSISHIL